jgi:hypothetical protein
MGNLLNNLVYNLTGTVSLIISVGLGVYLCYYTMKNGIRWLPLIGIFVVFSLSAYLVTQPGEIPAVGKAIFTLLKTLWGG